MYELCHNYLLMVIFCHLFWSVIPRRYCSMKFHEFNRDGNYRLSACAEQVQSGAGHVKPEGWLSEGKVLTIGSNEKKKQIHTKNLRLKL